MTHLSASVVPTQGFHAVLSTHITGPAPRNCSLNLSVILPPDCVLDPHELALQEREPALHVTVVGISELERPMHAVKPEHTQLLINAYFLDSETSENLSMTIDVPIHMRYPAPDVSASSLANVTIPWPTAYWNCTNTGLLTFRIIRHREPDDPSARHLDLSFIRTW